MNKDINTHELLSDITVYMKYAKYREDLKRRETWEEIIDRNKAMHLKKFPTIADQIESAFKYVYSKKVLPSMRSLQFAGEAIEKNPTRIFNCAFVAVDDYRAFSETMFLLLGGSGVGFSVQKHHINQLPPIKRPNYKRHRRFMIGDSIEGWADAVKAIIKNYLFGGSKVEFDFSDIRPKGARLITGGGKAPGPAPLKECLVKLENILENKREGERLTSIEVYDIMCHIANAVLAGGIRRSATICIFDKDDYDLLSSKSGDWHELNPQRGRANNSATLFRGETTHDEFLSVWHRTEMSNSGEPGIFWTADKEYGCNPCCVSGDTQVLTNIGNVRIDSIDKNVHTHVIVNGVEYKLKNWLHTGRKGVYKVTLANGMSVKVTHDHKLKTVNGEFIRCDELETGDIIQLNEPTESSLQDNKKNRSILKSQVSSVEYVGEEDVYDIEVDDVHEFSANGIIVHNCEISLRSKGFCNLCEVNVSDVTSQRDLNERVKAAAFIGTLQAAYSNFHYLREEWQENAEDSALLGISMTGICSGAVLKLDLEAAAKKVKEENFRVAKLIGINPSKRTTCVKPSGTSSIVLGCSSGIHAWFNDYYIRRVRVGKSEAIYSFLKTNHPELVVDDVYRPHDTAIIEIPMAAPRGAILRTETAIDMLERVKKFSLEWIKGGHKEGPNRHNVSATVYIDRLRRYRKEGDNYIFDPNGPMNEWEAVGDWMWVNQENYNGISVLPYDGGSYRQTPFEDITKERYLELIKKMPSSINFKAIIEEEDNTDLKGEAACAGGQCELK